MDKQIALLLSLTAGLLAQGRPGGPSPQSPPDTIYFNGNVVTMWAEHPVGSGRIRGDRFVAAGSAAEVRRLAGSATHQIDLRGRTVLPGLEDSHTHPISAALSEQDGVVPVMHSIPDILAYIKKLSATLPPDRVIFVPKVYSTRLAERRYPNRYELDEAAPDRAAMTDNGYASVLNSAALRKLGISRDSSQPENGKIIKDAKGEPTGLVLGAPQLLGMLRQSTPATHDDMLRALKAMQKAYNAVGLTSTIDRSEGPEGFRVYQELRRRDELTVRSYVTYLIGGQGTPAQVRQEIERIPFVTGLGDEWFRVGSLKVVADGGILIGTAYLREPYGQHTEIYGYDDPSYRGVLSVSRENLIEMARVANRLGWQMTAHTTGGGATDALLDAMTPPIASGPSPTADSRSRTATSPMLEPLNGPAAWESRSTHSPPGCIWMAQRSRTCSVRPACVISFRWDRCSGPA
jgi:predicted amidohydrolase YtcJ